MVNTTLIHATCIAIDGKGVLLLGKSGSGKSDLALRLIDEPGCGTGEKALHAQLVADDQVCLTQDGAQVLAQAPEALAGKLEMRGIGIVAAPYAGPVTVELVVELMDAEEIERMPDESQLQQNLLGIAMPRIMLDPNKPSSPARVRAALTSCTNWKKTGRICC